MPVILNLHLLPSRDLLLPDCGGVEFHGLFYNLLGEADSSLADRLHDKPGLKPYSIGGLRGGSLNEGCFFLPAAETAIFKLGLLTEELVRTWEEIIAGFGDGKKVQLGRGTVTLYVRGNMYYQNWDRLKPRNPWRTFNLRLLTPLAFKVGENNLPLPDPTRLLNSLADRWREFADVPLELTEGAIEGVKLSRYDLRSELRRLGRRSFVGAQGTMTLELPREGLRELAALLRLAEFCGIGSKTTMGMGEVEIIKNSSRSGR